MSDFKFNVEEVLSELGKVSEKGWGKSLTLTSFGDGEVKLDISSWNEDYTRMGKGVSLSDAEALDLFKALGEYFNAKDMLDDDIIGSIVGNE